MAKRDKRQAIVDAALRLFAERGEAAVSTAEVCRAACASNGSMFHFFASKEALAAAVYLTALESYQAATLAALASSGSARDGIRGFVQAHIRWVLAHPGPARCLHELRRGDAEHTVNEAIVQANDAYLRGVGGWVKQQLDRGALKPLAPELLLAIVFGPVHTLTRDWLRHGEARRLRGASEALADAAWAALAPAGPATKRGGRAPPGRSRRRFAG